MAPDMWTGWGIRTLSAEHPGYNPFSYHLGSVWPHDNATIAGGFRRYGRSDQAQRVAAGIFAAAERFESHRLPELFAGLAGSPKASRSSTSGRTCPRRGPPPRSSGSWRSCAGSTPPGAGGRIYVNPDLPDWLPDDHAAQPAGRERRGGPAHGARPARGPVELDGVRDRPGAGSATDALVARPGQPMTIDTSSSRPLSQSPPSAFAPIDTWAVFDRSPTVLVDFQIRPSTDRTTVVAWRSQVIVWNAPSARFGPVVFCHDPVEPLR